MLTSNNVLSAGQQTSGKMIVGLCQCQKTAFERVVIFNTAKHFYYSDRNTVCLKDLPFLFIRQHKLWNLLVWVSLLNHNWSATKQRPHPQSVAEISRHSVLSGDRIQQCETSSGSRHKETTVEWRALKDFHGNSLQLVHCCKHDCFLMLWIN